MPDGSFKCLDSNDCNKKLLDFFIFSAAAHVPTGITNIYPQTDFAKYILLLQEFSIISLNLIILYFFVFLISLNKLNVFRIESYLQSLVDFFASCLRSFYLTLELINILDYL